MSIKSIALILLACAALAASCASTKANYKKRNIEDRCDKELDSSQKFVDVNSKIQKNISSICVVEYTTKRFSREFLLGKPDSKPKENYGVIENEDEKQADLHNKKGNSNSGYKRIMVTRSADDDWPKEPKSQAEIRNTILWVLGLNILYFAVIKNLDSFAR